MGPLGRSRYSEAGQASVELVAVIPFVLLVGAVAWQFALAGHALWVTSHAARNAARADAVGGDVGAAARSALPRGLEKGIQVQRLRAGGVRVRVRMPLLAHTWRGPVTLAATASLGRGKP